MLPMRFLKLYFGGWIVDDCTYSYSEKNIIYHLIIKFLDFFHEDDIGYVKRKSEGGLLQWKCRTLGP